MADLIDRQAAIDELIKMLVYCFQADEELVDAVATTIKELSSAQPEIIRCKDCKHNPNETWFECPLAMFNENQRPETAWCWKGERRDDGDE